MMDNDGADVNYPNQSYDNQRDWGNPDPNQAPTQSPEELLVTLVAARLDTKYLCIGSQVCRAWRMCFYQPGLQQAPQLHAPELCYWDQGAGKLYLERLSSPMRWGGSRMRLPEWG